MLEAEKLFADPRRVGSRERAILPQTELSSSLIAMGPEDLDPSNFESLDLGHWWSTAPFTVMGDHMSAGLEIDSLDFLWATGRDN